MPVMVSVVRIKPKQRFGLRIDSGYRAGGFISVVVDHTGNDFPLNWGSAAEAMRWAQETGYTITLDTHSLPVPVGVACRADTKH